MACGGSARWLSATPRGTPMKAAVIVFPGSNCDRDIQVALTQSMGRPPLMVWHRQDAFPPVDLIVVPAGVSYGDYLRAGAMAANSPAIVETKRRAEAGVAVLGICNGFQILVESGLLPGALMQNRSQKFICKSVFTRVESVDTPFTNQCREQPVLKIPISHHEGSYFAPPETLKAMSDNHQVILRYCEPEGTVSEASNPNGSIENIAGVANEKKNVLGMMPHPERCADPLWPDRDGQLIFKSLIQSF